MSSAGLRTLLVGFVAASALLGLNACTAGSSSAASPTLKIKAATHQPIPTLTSTPTFNKTQFSIDDPASIWVVVNKTRPLNPLNYTPQLVTANVHYISSPLMRPEAAAALAAMFRASVAEGAGELQVQNSYRSYTLQVRVYNQWVAQLGKANADIQSARPGFSEHQTGFALDIATRPSTCEIQECFGAAPQGKWLAAHSYRFGYILRYPAGKQAVTGYIYEPWHFRYVGVALATEMHNTGVTTLEEFFGLPDAPDYAP